MDKSLYFTFFAALSAVVMAYFMARIALSRSEGNERMRLMAKAIQDGASAFLKEEAKRIAIIAILIAIQN
jgi:K(+)-stimulated pyrophosphate-energized sodium pump